MLLIWALPGVRRAIEIIPSWEPGVGPTETIPGGYQATHGSRGTPNQYVEVDPFFSPDDHSTNCTARRVLR